MKDSLSSTAKKFLDELRRRHLRARCANFGIVGTALVLAMVAIVVGIVPDQRTIVPACLGIVVGVLIAFDRAFAFGAVSDFLPAIIVEAEILQERIADANTPAALRRINSELRKLRRNVALSAPLGLKTEAVVSFYRQFNSTKQTPTEPDRGNKPKNRHKPRNRRRTNS